MNDCGTTDFIHHIENYLLHRFIFSCCNAFKSNFIRSSEVMVMAAGGKTKQNLLNLTHHDNKLESLTLCIR